ncbi:methyl-accepting chemotaxis sensory transducer, class 40H [Citrifermentans bemidjiense Bem]|uniref:Methyl-accepting chemotaxis sensory transducer, class 40H n=1 Tax=Citrifermentans bemidjiense (strain ATCC BAA-1014 / DSM 16622 / JCM 12645 / Bem) TaxID=404380 RepID=B5ECY9_CITBB|nr:methyl-accepting chemotaxis protein [Citrifermentans bemidjiense]ACH40606.1 methyl-accepting chemotaxis sensory transducer, class 40H [Citrifermentans bemidjiense Bem]
MTIKTKLTLNVIIVILIVAGVAVTSIVGMGFVNSRLQDLTQRSTPFQMRTVEFQRGIQEATADLIKVSASRNRGEFLAAKSEADKSLSQVQSGQAALQTLSGSVKIEGYEALSGIATELYKVTEGRLRAGEDAAAAQKTITERMRETTARLKELDGKVKGLQSTSSTSYSKSVGATKNVSDRAGNIDALKLTMKDFQLGLLEISKAQSKKGVLITQAKCNSAMNKALQNQAAKDSNSISSELKLLGSKIPPFIKLQNAALEPGATDTSARDQLFGEIVHMLSTINLALEQESAMASDTLSAETRKQSTYFGNSNLATYVMAGNSELLSLGLKVDGLVAKLFTAASVQEVDAIQAELSGIFARIGQTDAMLAKSLAKLNASREAAILKQAGGALESIRGLLTLKDGVIAKLRNRLEMENQAATAKGKLREIVLKQAESGKQTVSVAQVNQEKAIATVNKMVRFTTLLVGAISIGAALFGMIFGSWVYRSISKPLAQLLGVSQAVAKGDLAVKIDTTNKDEVGKVQLAMAEMVDNLRGMVGKIKGATESLASSSEELSATAVALERGAEEQTTRIDHSATAMTEMTQTTIEVARNSTDTSDAAAQMKAIAERGRSAMQVTANELDQFAESVKEAAGKVESLGKQSEEISDVVTLINDIANQTNLLALNAAIEAARAGEQGRGFAVVADNVRELAERTATATSDISQTVKNMQGSVKSSVDFMYAERDSVQRVQEQVQQTTAAIGEIVTFVEQVADMVQRIAVAAEEQSSTSEEVSHNMDGIQNIAGELRSSFADIKNSSGSLSHLATELNGMVGWFKV